MRRSDEKRMSWLLRHQPNNITAINTLRASMDRKKPVAPKPKAVLFPPCSGVPDSLMEDYERFRAGAVYQTGSSLETFKAYCWYLKLNK
jgi:hypothetical protein